MSEAPSRLRALALETLSKTDGDLAKAARALDLQLAGKTDLRVALAMDYLSRLTASARPSSPASVLTPKSASPIPGMRAAAEEPAAPKAAKEIGARRRGGPHRRGTGMPTAAQKAGALRAASDTASGIFDRKLRGGRRLRSIKIHELRAIVFESGIAAGSFLKRG